MSRTTDELRARNWAVKGWAFKDLPEKENEAIIKFLDGGKCPEGYEKFYALCRRHLKLPEFKDKECPI
jgi:hypothetical protein